MLDGSSATSFFVGFFTACTTTTFWRAHVKARALLGENGEPEEDFEMPDLSEALPAHDYDTLYRYVPLY